MATKAVQKRNEKAQQLKVLQSSDGNFYVESSEGKNPVQSPVFRSRYGVLMR